MAARHRYMKEKIGAYQELPHGRRTGQKCVPKEDYPKIAARARSELLSAIGRDYGVTGETIRRIVRRVGE